MKKILICNIPMNVKEKCVYENGLSKSRISTDLFYYPVNAYLSKNMKSTDDWKVILLVKKDGLGREALATQLFCDELNQVNLTVKAKIEYITIDTDFEEAKRVHDQLLGSLIDEIEDESEIYADITFGPKDLPVIVFSALNFAENFLDCDIKHIFYSQAVFNQDNKIVSNKLVTMDSLYSLQSLVSEVKTDDPKQARDLLKLLISL